MSSEGYVDDVLAMAEIEKLRKYGSATKTQHASFSPFISQWCNGSWGSCVTWGKHYGEVLSWVRTRMCFTVIRATNLCLLWLRVCWRSDTGKDDGAGLPAVMPVQIYAG